MNDVLSMCADVRRRVAEIQMAEIEERAMHAAAAGFDMAVSPVAVGEIEPDAQRRVMSVKQDVKLLRPGESAPAGWHVYALARLHPALMAAGGIARHAHRLATGRGICDQCGGSGRQGMKNCFWCEGRGWRL